MIQNVFACISEASEGMGGEPKQNVVLKIAWSSEGRARGEMGKEGRKAWEGLDPNSSTAAKMPRKVSLKEACTHPGDPSPPPFLPLPSQHNLSPPFYIPRAGSEQGRAEVHCAREISSCKKEPEMQVDPPTPTTAGAPPLPCCVQTTRLLPGPPFLIF